MCLYKQQGAKVFWFKAKCTIVCALIASSLITPIFARLKKEGALFSVKTPLSERAFEYETPYEKKVEYKNYGMYFGDEKRPSFNIRIKGIGKDFNIYLDSIYISKQFYYEIGKDNKTRIFGDSIHYGNRIERIDSTKNPIFKVFLGRKTTSDPWYLNLSKIDKNSYIDSIKFGPDGKLILIKDREGNQIEKDVGGYFTAKEIAKNKYLIEITLFKGFNPSLELEENKFNKLILNLGFYVGELYTKHENAIVCTMEPPLGKIRIFDYPTMSFKDTTISTAILRAKIITEYADTAAIRVYREIEKNPKSWYDYMGAHKELVLYTLPDGNKPIWPKSVYFAYQGVMDYVESISIIQKEVVFPVDKAFDHIEENSQAPERKYFHCFARYKYPGYSTPQFSYKAPDTAAYYLSAKWPGIWTRGPPGSIQNYTVLSDSFWISFGFGRYWVSAGDGEQFAYTDSYEWSPLTTIKDANDFGFSIYAYNLKAKTYGIFAMIVPAIKDNTGWRFRYDSALVTTGWNLNLTIPSDSLVNTMVRLGDKIVDLYAGDKVYKSRIYDGKTGEIGYPLYWSWRFSEKGDSLIIYDENKLYKFNERELFLSFENWNTFVDTTKPFAIEFIPRIGQEDVDTNVFIKVKWSEKINPYKIESLVYEYKNEENRKIETGYILENEDSTAVLWPLNGAFSNNSKIVYKLTVEDLNKNQGTAEGYFYTKKLNLEVREEDILNLTNEIKIYDLLGSVVRVFKPEEKINLENLPAGAYIIYDGKQARLLVRY